MSVEQGLTSWKIQRRYTEFRQLHQTIISASGLDLIFPGKKMTGNQNKDFIASRQVALQQFISCLCLDPILRHSLAFKTFLSPAVNFTDCTQTSNEHGNSKEKRLNKHFSFE